MKKIWSKTWFKVICVLLVLLIVTALCMNSILRSIGGWLSASDSPQLTSMCFVLGGNSYERGTAAVEIYKQFPEQRFITTGGNYPYQILCLDTSMLECELTRHLMLSRGVPSEHVDTLSSAHSTMDESNEIFGARPIDYNKLNWWNNEEGLIMTNNELVKIIYYSLKY